MAPLSTSTAAFKIVNSSVNSFNIDVKPAESVAYGILAASANVTISSGNVDPNGKIWTAGVAISSWTTNSYSSITVQVAQGLYVSGENNTISYSTASVKSGSTTRYSLYLSAASTNSITNSYFVNNSNVVGAAMQLLSSRYNTIANNRFYSPGGTFVALIDKNRITSSRIPACCASIRFDAEL